MHPSTSHLAAFLGTGLFLGTPLLYIIITIKQAMARMQLLEHGARGLHRRQSQCLPNRFSLGKNQRQTVLSYATVTHSHTQTRFERYGFESPFLLRRITASTM